MGAFFILLITLSWLNELFDLYRYIFGGGKASVNWNEIMAESVLIALIGAITVSFLIRYAAHRRRLEERLLQYQNFLEEMVEKRTVALRHMVDAMALRIGHVADLEIENGKLKTRLARLEAQAADPAISHIAGEHRASGEKPPLP